MTAPLLQLSGIHKSFPGVRANDDVDLTLRAGEIHALLGENGAGKSTLVKIIYGLMAPDAGSIRWQGDTVTITGPKAARRRGIAMVFQHFSLFESMTVLENIALALPDERDMSALSERIVAVSYGYGLALEPDRPVHTLSVGQRQRIEIVRCLLQDPRLLILDEPTSVLTPQEAENLFGTLRQLAHEGRAILYISHKLAEVRALCDSATIMRRGRVVAQCTPREETNESLAEKMIGSVVKRADRQQAPTGADIRFEVTDVSLPRRSEFDVPLSDISLQLCGREILGIAGVAGNGQGELLSVLSGERRLPAGSGDVRLDGRSVSRLGASARRRLGLTYVPEHRIGQGAVADMPLWENAMLTGFIRRALLRLGFIRRDDSRAFADDIIGRFDVRAGGVSAEAASLSGGNLQKFIVGREVMQAPCVLIVAQPTWGVDAGAAARIHEALAELAAAGTAILLVSQDLDEVFAICDRIAVIAGGRLSATYATDQVTEAQVGLMMAGAGDGGDAGGGPPAALEPVGA